MTTPLHRRLALLLICTVATPALAQPAGHLPSQPGSQRLPAIPSARLVEIHLQSAEELTVLEESHPGSSLPLGGPDHWAKACNAPCDVEVHPGQRLRLVGVDGPSGRVIEVPEGAGRLDVVARVGSPKKVAAGQVLTAVGVGVELLAAVPIGIAIANPWPNTVPNVIPLAVGLLIAAIGAVDLAIAIPTWVTSVDRTEVSSSASPDLSSGATLSRR